MIEFEVVISHIYLWPGLFILFCLSLMLSFWLEKENDGKEKWREWIDLFRYCIDRKDRIKISQLVCPCNRL